MSNIPRKKLLDVLVQQWPHLSREKILALVLCGEIRVDGEVVRDPRLKIPIQAELTLSPETYVSRAGYKLEAALVAWEFVVRDKVILDVGASTGGFTEALLRHGAGLVYSVDVARGFLAPRLVNHPRVVNMEGTNVRNLPKLDPVPQGAVMDISFRSVDEVVPLVLEKVTEQWLICLVKPQFEFKKYGPSGVVFQGVLGDEAARETLERLLDYLDSRGIVAEKVMPSPVRGRRGNQEYLVLFRPSDNADHAGSGKS